MDLVTFINLPFADGRYRFQLRGRQIAELQEKCGAGIGAIFNRLLQGRVLVAAGNEPKNLGLPTHAAYRHADVRETLRLGLIGGGEGEVNGEKVNVTAATAATLVGRYVDGRPLKEAWDLATAIVGALIEGVPASASAAEPTAGAPAPQEP